VTWGEPTGPIDVTPSDLNAAATTFAGGQNRLDGIATTLGAALRDAAGMAGDDTYGKQFAKGYDPAAKALFRTISAAVRAIGQSAEGLVRTANNYLKADHHSNPHKGKGVPKLFGWPDVVDDIMYPDPPTAIGSGSNHWPPPLNKYWVNGHQDKLRRAAAAFRTAATDINGLGVTLHLQVQAITDVNTSGAVTAMAAFWRRIWQDGDPGGLAPLSTAHLACTKLATVCEQFAHAIDQAHSKFEHKMSEAGIAMGLTTTIGFLGSVFTFGASDAGAAALDAGEAAALFAAVDEVMDAAMVDYAAEGMAELETVLASAAEEVPEVEAIDAETTEVTQALDREMAEAEARGGGSGGKGGGGGGGRTPPEEEPPEEEPSGGRKSQERGRRYEKHLVDRLGGRDGFSEGGRQFDGAFEEDGAEYWYEAKSGGYWELAQRNAKVMEKFRSNLGDARRIATANGKKFCLISENPIPQDIMEWLTKKGFSWKIIPMG
jgi:hypothetical protein